MKRFNTKRIRIPKIEIETDREREKSRHTQQISKRQINPNTVLAGDYNTQRSALESSSRQKTK